MEPMVSRGNNPELWGKLMDTLDDKLQLGLLDRLRRVSSYHFEDNVLFIEAGTAEDEVYLLKSATVQQLMIIAQDATGVQEVKVKKRESWPTALLAELK